MEVNKGYSNDLKNWNVKRRVSKRSVVTIREQVNSPMFCVTNSLKQKSIWFILLLCCSSCTIGPKYSKPTMTIPDSFKEGGILWKSAKPIVQEDVGEWWKIFNDPVLHQLEERLNINNQNIRAAEAQYRQALALANKARASYFPTITSMYALTRQRQIAHVGLPPTISNDKALQLNANWELDLWGNVRQNVKASLAASEASKASLAFIRLSAQSSLAQYYFELRTLDHDQVLLDKLVITWQKILDYYKNRKLSGVAFQMDILTAENNLYAAKILAANNGINRAEYQHAIAVLIGESPSAFTIEKSNRTSSFSLQDIPVRIPSELLERRPDIVQAERLVAQANAQIGIAQTAYFPNLTLAATGALEGTGFGHLLALPTFLWSLGPQLSATLFDGGARSSNIKAAKAGYEASVASYRQTVLTAFQEVEDSLVSLNILDSQAQIQNEISKNALAAYKLALNQYKIGITDYSALLTAEINLYNANKNAVDTEGLRTVAAIGLIKALGGGWNGGQYQ